MKLVLFYLTNSSRHYTFNHFVSLLNTSNYKDDWVLLVLTNSNDTAFYSSELAKTSIHHSIVNVPDHNNYMVKVHTACQFAESYNIPYMMKCDNDIFFTSNTLDAIIDNLHVLESNTHLTLGPILSSGIPSVEYFANDFLPEHVRNKLHDLYLQTNFYDRDGACYSHLNQFTKESLTWDSTSFFECVKDINHHYKGVHPIRFSNDAINLVNEFILNNKKMFFDSMPTGVILDNKAPYLCDSVFAIKTSTYKSIITDTSLFVDGYDEVPLNKYAWKNNMNHVFIKGSFGIHILYNWFSNIFAYEDHFCKLLFSD